MTVLVIVISVRDGAIVHEKNHCNNNGSVGSCQKITSITITSVGICILILCITITILL